MTKFQISLCEELTKIKEREIYPKECFESEIQINFVVHLEEAKPCLCRIEEAFPCFLQHNLHFENQLMNQISNIDFEHFANGDS